MSPQQFDRYLPAEAPQSVPFHNPGGPYEPPVVPKWDTRRPDRLPSQEKLECVVRTSALDQFAGKWSGLIVWGRAWALHGTGVLASVFVRCVAGICAKPLFLAVALLVSLSLGIKEARRRVQAKSRLGDRSLADGSPQAAGALPASAMILAPLQIVCRFFLPLFLPIFVSSVFGTSIFAQKAIAVVVFLFAGLAADAIATHYAFFMTAHPQMRFTSMKRRREWWDLRLRTWRLPDVVKTLKRQAEDEERKGDAFSANAIQGQLGEAPIIAQYWAGIVPVLCGGLLAGFVPVRLLPIIYLGLCLAWAYRTPRQMLPPKEFISQVLLPACRSWIMSNLWEHPLSSGPPGTFRSPIGIAAERRLIVWFPCFLLSLLLVPLPFDWGIEPITSPRGLLMFMADETFMVALPIAIVLTSFLAVAGPALSAFHLAIESGSGSETKERRHLTTFRSIAQKYAESADPVEREMFFVGTHSELGYPVSVPRSCFTHSMIEGPTGRGKTSIGVAQRLVQYIMRGDTPIVVIDNKGDYALFHQLREEAKAHGRTFRFFTTEQGLSTHVFNPLQEFSADLISTNHKTQSLMDCLRLYTGEKYGEKYFAAVKQEALQDLFERYPEIESFEEAYRKTGREFFERDIDRDRAKELVVVLKHLAGIEALNWTRKKAPKEVFSGSIYMPRVLELNEIVYFWLPVVGESAAARDVSNLAAYALLNECKMYQRIHRQTKHVALLIDEFAVMASVAFETILQQSRSYGISALLSVQTQTDLKKNTPTLLNSLLSNTAFRMFFSPSNPDTEDYLIEQSGESMYWYYSHLPPGLKPGKRFSRNDIKAITSKPLTAFVQIPFDTDHACYGGHLIPVQLMHHMSKEAYDELEKRPWPEPTEETIVVTKQARKAAGGDQRTAKILGTNAPIQAEERADSSAPMSPWKKRLLDAYERRSRGKEI